MKYEAFRIHDYSVSLTCWISFQGGIDTTSAWRNETFVWTESDRRVCKIPI